MMILKKTFQFFILFVLFHCSGKTTQTTINTELSSSTVKIAEQDGVTVDTNVAHVTIPQGAMTTGNIVTIKNFNGMPEELSSVLQNHIPMTQGYLELTTEKSTNDKTQVETSKTPINIEFHIDPEVVGALSVQDKIFVFILQKKIAGVIALVDYSAKLAVSEENLIINLNSSSPSMTLTTNLTNAVLMPVAIASTSLPHGFIASKGIVETKEKIVMQPIKTPPTLAPLSITFTDEDLERGEISGNVSLTKASNESNIEFYNLYWGASESAKISATKITSFTVNGSNQTYSFEAHTKIAEGATHLLAFSANSAGEMSSPSYVLITDKGVPLHAPVSASFNDTHPEAGKVSGILMITEPSDETDITEFVVYWASSTGVKLSSALVKKPKSGSDELLSLALEAEIPSGAAELLVLSANQDGEMSDGVHIPLIDLGAPTHTASDISFTDSDLAGGLIQGTVYITKASDESDLTDYVLYWGYSTTDKSTTTAITEIPATGSDLSYSFSSSTPVPQGSSYFLVRTKYKNGEMSNGIYTAIADKGLPLHAAVSSTFTDTNVTGSLIAGTLNITKALDESDMTHYVLYWGKTDGQKLDNVRLVEPIVKTGFDLIYTLEPKTLPTNATKILIKTINADGEMVDGISVDIVDVDINTDPTLCRSQSMYYYNASCHQAAITCDISAAKRAISGDSENCTDITIANAQNSSECTAVSGTWFASSCHVEAATKLVWTATGGTQYRKLCSSAFTVQLQDVNSASVQYSGTGGLSVQLESLVSGTASSHSAFYSTSDCSGSAITSVTIPYQQSQASVYLKHTAVETITVNSNVSGLTSASNSKSVTELTFTTTAASPRLWFDAADSTDTSKMTNTGGVFTWKNRGTGVSGNALNATQSTSSLAPVVQTEIKNGQDVLSFSTKYLSFTEQSLTNLTLSFVAKTSGDTMILGATSSNVQFREYMPDSYSLTFYSQLSSPYYYIIDNATNHPVDQWHISTWVFNTSTSKLSFYYNGRYISMGISPWTTTYTGNAKMGQVGNLLTNAGVSNALIGEIIVHPSALSTDDRQAVEDYLSRKWGITLER